jgi:hypothetical protein
MRARCSGVAAAARGAYFRGMSLDEGVEVDLPLGGMSMAQCCASCCGPYETVRQTQGHRSAGNKTQTLTISVPYCTACADRLDAALKRKRQWLVVNLIACVVLALLPFALPFLPIPVVVVLAVAAATALPIGLALKAGPPEPPAPATAIAEAAWVPKMSAANITMHCTSVKWGELLASANGVASRPKKRAQRLRGSLWGIALFTTLPGAIGVAYASKPLLYVDVNGTEPLAVWVDGSQVLVAEPKHGLGARPSVRVRYGDHTFGVSKVGANKPDHEVKGHLEVAGDHLYNPGMTSCYWLDVAAYGSAKTDGMQQGPVAIEEVYTFKHIDQWFAENPTSISTKSSGETRTALHPFVACEQLAQQGCPVAARNQLVQCAQQAIARDNEEAFKACLDKVDEACAAPAKSPTSL